MIQLNLIYFLDWVAPTARFLYGSYWDPKKNSTMAVFSRKSNTGADTVVLTNPQKFSDKIINNILCTMILINFLFGGLANMMSSNGDIFRITGLLWGEITAHRWIPAQRPVM